MRSLASEYHYFVPYTMHEMEHQINIGFQWFTIGNYRSLKDKELDVRTALEPMKILSLSSTSDNEIKTQKSEKSLLSGIEALTIILACVIFLGAFTAAICVACFNRKK